MFNSASEIVRDAIKKSHLNQESFSKKLGVSQSQISKYLSGKSQPNAQTIIHCMNIIEQHRSTARAKTPHDILLRKIKNLTGEYSEDICKSLLQVLATYERLTSDFDN